MDPHGPYSVVAAVKGPFYTGNTTVDLFSAGLEDSRPDGGHLGCVFGTDDRCQHVSAEGRTALQQQSRFRIDLEFRTVGGQSRLQPCCQSRQQRTTPVCRRSEDDGGPYLLDDGEHRVDGITRFECPRRLSDEVDLVRHILCAIRCIRVVDRQKYYYLSAALRSEVASRIHQFERRGVSVAAAVFSDYDDYGMLNNGRFCRRLVRRSWGCRRRRRLNRLIRRWISIRVIRDTVNRIQEKLADGRGGLVFAAMKEDRLFRVTHSCDTSHPGRGARKADCFTRKPKSTVVDEFDLGMPGRMPRGERGFSGYVQFLHYG